MKISTRFSVAIHILAIIEVRPDIQSTSDIIALSVNTNPVVIRKLMSMLKKSGILEAQKGKRGTFLAKKAEDISLLDIYRSVNSVPEGQLFDIHENTSQDCSVGVHIQTSVGKYVDRAQQAMEKELAKSTLADIAFDLVSEIEKDYKIHS